MRRGCSTRCKDPATGYYDPRDPFTALPKALIPEQPYASFAVTEAALSGDAKPLQGMRIAILREHMVKRTPNHEAISDQIDRRSRRCCATSSAPSWSKPMTPDYPDDPDVPNSTYTLRRRAVGDPAAVDAGDLLAARRQAASCCSRCPATT